MKNPKKDTVLYVSDNKSDISLLENSFNIIIASSFKEAMSILTSNMKIKVVIVDQSTRVTESIEFLEILMKEHPNQMRLVVSDHVDANETRRDINKAHIYRYITKPWRPEDVIQIIQDACLIYDNDKKNRNLIVSLERALEHQKLVIATFEKYVPKAVLEHVIKSKNQGMLVGQTKIVAILFVDIRKSVNLTEKLPPRVVVQALNSFFNLMNRCVKAHSGVINKYLGDGILAIFGAPVSSLDNPNNSLSSAIDMIQGLKEFNEEWRSKIGEDLKIGIGIHSGEVIIGSIGSEDHYEYGVVGDAVNVASRLEYLTHDTPNSIIFSQSVYDKIIPHLKEQAVSIGETEIRGKKDPLNLYMIKEKAVGND